MIGVAADAADLETVEEFFELFKTPWEHAVPGRKYRVVLSTNGCVEHLQADQFLLYGSCAGVHDRAAGVGVELVDGPVTLEWGGTTIPIYGRLASFDTVEGSLKSCGKAVDYTRQSGDQAVRRIGYDLFEEVKHLLTIGQPASESLSPTLELHIAVLRQLLQESGIAYVEVPPRPAGHDFICCLTHDVDFFGIRRHAFDRTLAGFAMRASVGTLADLVRGRRTFDEAMQNWKALCSLPLVLMGLKRDFWQPFDDYAKVEAPRRSTFFLVPIKDHPGVAPDGTTDQARAVPYEVRDIRDAAGQAMARGSELAIHGIDAWRDANAGRSERDELTAVTGQRTAGVRMHWLYFDAQSPKKLEAAGFAYDSTCGHNEAVGYRAGTSQVYRLPGTAQLMELPLSIMDSALFSSGRMGLGPDVADALCRRVIANARRLGGTLVINWHCRSLAPERLWGRFYQELLGEVERGGRVWFATAGEAVDWFRWRRSIQFRSVGDVEGGEVEVSAPRSVGPVVGVVRVHKPGARGECVEDKAFSGAASLRVEVEFTNPLRIYG